MQKQNWVLLAVALASFLLGLDALLVTTAPPTIRRDLEASPSQLAWAVTAYTLGFAVLLMCAAAPGDRYERRRMFNAGVALFGLASAGSLR
jgi:MFS family permease